MALKTVCVVPNDWTIDTYRTHSCLDASHVHISYAELSDNKLRNVVKVLQESHSRREKTVVQIFAVPEVRKPNVTKTVCMPRSLNYGLSYKVGEELAERIRKNESWALTMWNQIKNRREDAIQRIDLDLQLGEILV